MQFDGNYHANDLTVMETFVYSGCKCYNLPNSCMYEAVKASLKEQSRNRLRCQALKAPLSPSVNFQIA